MISFSLLALFLVSLVYTWYWIGKKDERKGLQRIPGPKGLPLIGNILQLGKQPHLQISKWSEEYGEIYQARLGPIVNIFISNPKMLKEMFSNDPNYVGRPQIEGLRVYADESLGIINTEGELWEVHRRFLLRQLREFGFGKPSMESLILEDVNGVVKAFKESEGEPITDIKAVLSIAVVNALWLVVGGKRFQHDDPTLIWLITTAEKALEELTKDGAMLVFFPWLRYVAPQLSGYNSIRRVMDENRKWFENAVEEHKRTFQEENLRDFIDVYLAEMKKTTDPNSVFHGAVAERQLVALLIDMSFAGSDTTSATLAWAILYLCKYPESQRKFQDEIGTVTGNIRNVVLADRPNMPYTLALMDEVLRYSSILTNVGQHRALEDKEFQGYYIPKNAWISPSMHYMHHNPNVWGDPSAFRPERFLSRDGKYQKNENLIPFQIGRRKCAGETLARDTMFLYLANIFQQFDVCFDPNSLEPSVEPQASMHIVLHPQPYSVVVRGRL